MDDNLRKRLSKAVREGNLPFVRSCLDTGTSANEVVNVDGRQILILRLAVEWNRKEIAELLLARGANVNGTTVGGATALHAACRRGVVLRDLGIIRLLLEAGADVRAATEYGMTSLHDAFACVAATPDDVERHKAVIRLLVARGADLSAADTQGETPCFRVYPDLTLLSFVVDELGVDIGALRNNRGHTMLFAEEVLVANGIPKFLLECGIDVNARSSFGDTALHAAAACSTLENFKTLLEGGADVNAADNAGWRPLHYACTDGTAEHIIMLMQGGADPSGTPAQHFRWTSLEMGLAVRLAQHLSSLRARRGPLDPSLAWLKWLATSAPEPPLADLALPASTPPLTRDEMTAALRDNAFDRRKLLVHCYFETRRLRREGGEGKEEKAGKGPA